MKYDIQSKLYRVSILFEILVGVSILVAIGASLIGLIADIQVAKFIDSPFVLQSYLRTAMTVVIGIEFVKMIFSHSIDSVVEVMLLAIARQMVVEHTSPLENLLAILSIAILYIIRKYLFIRHLDEVPEGGPVSFLKDFLGRSNNLKADHSAEKPTPDRTAEDHVPHPHAFTRTDPYAAANPDKNEPPKTS